MPLPSSPPPTSSGTYRVRGRVLVIDDEPLLGRALSRALAEQNEVVVVADATEALARLSAGEHFDVVLCDLMMPGMDGIEFHRQLAAVAPAEANRVVFITGGALTARVESFLRRIPNLLLDKPIDIDGLRSLIERRVRCSAPTEPPASAGERVAEPSSGRSRGAAG